jgi:hypothetical protein
MLNNITADLSLINRTTYPNLQFDVKLEGTSNQSINFNVTLSGELVPQICFQTIVKQDCSISSISNYIDLLDNAVSPNTLVKSSQTATLSVNKKSTCGGSTTNQPPVLTDQSASIAVGAVGQVVDLNATDTNTTDVLTYSIIAGNTDQYFTLDQSTGVISVNATKQPPAGNYSLTIEVSDGNGGKDTAVISIAVGGSSTSTVDLSIIKTIVSSDNTPGGEIKYKLTVNNLSSQTVNQVIVTDALPEALVAQNSFWRCDILIEGSNCGSKIDGTGSISVTDIKLSPLGSIVYSIVAKISSSASSTFSNTARVSCATCNETNLANNVSTVGSVLGTTSTNNTTNTTTTPVTTNNSTGTAATNNSPATGTANTTTSRLPATGLMNYPLTTILLLLSISVAIVFNADSISKLLVRHTKKSF